MMAFTPGELAQFRAVQAGSLMDTCVPLTYEEGAPGDLGTPSGAAWVEGNELACGFRPSSKREVLEKTGVVIADAELRLPIDTLIDTNARIKLTYRYGEELETQPVYAILGEPERGPSGLVLALRKVTDGT